MTGAVDRALRLWEQPIPPDEAAMAAFREAYADPLVINGVEWTVAALVKRARTTQAVLADIGFEVVDRIDAGDRCAIAFRQWGRHVGTMPGGHPLPPSGERVEGLRRGTRGKDRTSRDRSRSARPAGGHRRMAVAAGRQSWATATTTSPSEDP